MSPLIINSDKGCSIEERLAFLQEVNDIIINLVTTLSIQFGLQQSHKEDIVSTDMTFPWSNKQINPGTAKSPLSTLQHGAGDLRQYYISTGPMWVKSHIQNVWPVFLNWFSFWSYCVNETNIST